MSKPLTASADQAPARAARLGFICLLLWLSLPLAFALPWPVMAVFGVLWAVQLGRLAGSAQPLRPWLVGIGGLAVGGFVFSQLGTIVGSEGGSALLLLLLLLKSYESRRLRDWHIQLIGMVFLSGATVLLNQNLLIGAWLLAGLFGIAACAALLNMPPRPAARHAATALLLTLPLAAVLFVAVPRLSEPLWRIPQPKQHQAQTGLSDTMQPGSISQLVQSNQLAFNATFDAGFMPQRHQLYWRAITMSRFDGRQWSADNDHADSAARFDTTAETVAYSMILRDERGRIPALDYPQISRQAAQSRSKMRYAEGHTVRVNSHEGLRRFHLQAGLGDRLPERLAAGRRAALTALPGTANPRVRQLAQQLHSQSASPQDYIARVLDYYRRQQFAYTLSPPLTTGPNRIDDFMFATKQGFCEHYAESFVVMMRAAGLPARVVTGYLGGEYNADGGFWQVRGRDAHAWAEVWLPQEQVWLRIDPTAAANQNFLEQSLNAALSENDQELIAGNRSWAWLSQVSAQSQYYWQQWVVNYDQSAQNDLFRRLGLGGFGLASLLLFLAVGLGLAAWPLWLWWRRQQRRGAHPLEDGFALLKSRLIDADEVELAALGPLETEQTLAENGLLTPELTHLLQQYRRWNYADGLPARAEQKRWYRRCLRALKQVRKA